MPLQNSGPISLADIAGEFGGSTPHSMSEYYGASSGIPASGTISMNQFYGASALAQFTLTSNQQDFNARNWLIGQGWSGSGAVQLTIASNVYIYASSTSAYAFNMGGSYPAGLTLINNGRIMARGGNAATNNNFTSAFSQPIPNNGGSGGTAMYLTGNITIQNNGYIGGGGGGGNPTDFTLDIAEVTAETGDLVCLDVTTFNFDNILAMQFSMNYDATALTYNSIQNINLVDLLPTNFGNPYPGDLTNDNGRSTKKSTLPCTIKVSKRFLA